MSINCPFSKHVLRVDKEECRPRYWKTEGPDINGRTYSQQIIHVFHKYCEDANVSWVNYIRMQHPAFLSHLLLAMYWSPTLVWIPFKNSVRTAKKTQHFTIAKINWLTLFEEIIAVHTENHTKHINTLRGQNAAAVNVKARGTYSYDWASKG
jgi:hypothetical protein